MVCETMGGSPRPGSSRSCAARESSSRRSECSRVKKMAHPARTSATSQTSAYHRGTPPVNDAVGYVPHTAPESSGRKHVAEEVLIHIQGRQSNGT